jgi:ComF family protein
MGVLDLLIPEHCVACSRDGVLCEACLTRLVPIREPLCARCGAPVAWPVQRCAECAGRRLSFALARSAIAYEGPAVELVRAWKEGGRRRLAQLAARFMVGSMPTPLADAVTFVPSVHERELWRGHNPARALAGELAAAWALPVRPLLARASSARRQRGLGLAERRANVREAFAATERVPPHVVLVDDVYTSGATVNAAAGALRRAGAARVEVVTLARTLRGPGPRARART